MGCPHAGSLIRIPVLFLFVQPVAAPLPLPPEQPASSVPAPSGNIRSPYVGASACGKCHQSIHESFRQTTHYLTSQLPRANSILGSFEPARALLRTRNPDLWFEMRASEDGFLQTAWSREQGRIVPRTERMDIVVGSGKMGQTYLYWRGSKLFQLPVSYFTEAKRWINSPGYPDGQAYFDRPVNPRCLECHATYFEVDSEEDPMRPYLSNVYSRNNYLLGVTCERCHGPGGLHSKNPPERSGSGASSDIVHPGKLERELQMTLCAQCHSGHLVPRNGPFSFRPGQGPEAFIAVESLRARNSGGVHTTNQPDRLRRSRCFQESGSLTCNSCHDPHHLERGNLQLFSRRCMTCHQPHVCGMAATLGDSIEGNCIDCHMPVQRDLGTPMETAGGFETPRMRDHNVAIYRNVAERLLKQFRQKDSSQR